MGRKAAQISSQRRLSEVLWEQGFPLAGDAWGQARLGYRKCQEKAQFCKTGAEGEEGEEGNPKAAIGIVPSTMLEDSDFILRPWYILKAGL